MTPFHVLSKLDIRYVVSYFGQSRFFEALPLLVMQFQDMSSWTGQPF